MPNQIEKQIDLKAPVARVWRAITDHREFGQWFKVHLEPIDVGTRLTIVESGFDQVPDYRRAEAFRMDDHGWMSQIKNIEKHVTGNA